MPKIPDEIWEQYRDLEFYPDPICCSCPCKGKIPVKPYHRGYGIPRYLGGHQGGKHIPKMNAEEWSKYKDLEFYPNHFCGCPCKGKIPVHSQHKTRGIPKYLRGHHPVDSRIGNSRILKERWEDPEWRANTIAAMLEASARPEVQDKRRKARSDLAKEGIRAGHGTECSGPDWWLTFRDFVLSACRLFEIPYVQASRFIREAIKEKGLVRFDIVLFLNFSVGHNQWELAEQYGITTDSVKTILKKLCKVYPYVFQDGASAIESQMLTFENWMKYKKDF